MHRLSLLSLLLLVLLSLLTSTTHSQPLLPNDAASLLTFKSKADLNNTLLFTLHEHFDYCHWRGVKCQQGRVVRFSLPNQGLFGTIPPNSLPLLSHLRVLVLRHNSLSGPLPPLSSLPNLRSLLLDHNHFSSFLPASLSSLHHLRFLNLSSNNFSGTIPQPLSRFPPSAFALNPNLCGDVINKPCASPPPSPSPFFDSATHPLPQQHPSTPPSLSNNDTVSFLSPTQTTSHRKKLLMTLAFSMGGLLLVSSFLCMIFTARMKTRTTAMSMRKDSNNTSTNNNVAQVATSEPEVVTLRLANSRTTELKEKCKELVEGGGAVGDDRKRREKSGGGGGGDLVFCGGEVRLYTLEQLMRGSAEMLGRGTMGTTYKAKLDNQLILTVKRLDAMKMSGIDGEMFERVMDTIGGLRHPNLVPVRAYFQANDERLIIFDYQPNGSVFNLIHGSRSTRAKPLHWTSCLKIAEDVAQGLAYIHQASKLIHGNLKASNVLLGTDFEACVTDYCLSALSATSCSDNEDPDSARYRGPEARNSTWKLTPKMDVYAFGVLLLELLSGKPPSQHPFLAPHDMLDWVKSMRGDDDSFEDNHLTMLVEVASLCSLTSPEQRPPIWQVLKMIQKIKACVGSDDAVDPTTGYPK